MESGWASCLARPKHRIRLHQRPTPCNEWKIPNSLLPKKLHDCTFWIKRDDFTGLECSGNKIRKLEFLLAEAKQQGCDTLVSYGKKQSNWCRAVATAGSKLGFEVHLILNCEDTECYEASALNGNYLVDLLMGAHIHMIKPQVYQQFDDNYQDNKLLLSLTQHLTSKGKKCYSLCCGGSNAIGTFGYIDMVGELEQQLTCNISDVVVATASGGTAIGIGVGTYLSNKFDRTKIHAMGTMGESVQKYYKPVGDTLLRELGFDRVSKITDVTELIDFHDATGRGYSKNTPKELQFFFDLSRTTGVLVDPVYSGKALYYFLRGVQNGTIQPKGKNILFVHTGGTFAYFDPKRVEMLNASVPLLQQREYEFVSKL